jgi:hypothetical protein
MKNLSISIEHKDEAISLFEQLGYKENTKWNETVKNWTEITHIVTYKDGTWELHNHDGKPSSTPITIEDTA